MPHEITPSFKEMSRIMREYRENPRDLNPMQAYAMRRMVAIQDAYDRSYENLGAQEEAYEMREMNTRINTVPVLGMPQTPTETTHSEDVNVEEDDDVTPAQRRRRRIIRLNRALLRQLRLDVSDSSPDDAAPPIEESVSPITSDEAPRRSRRHTGDNRDLDRPIPLDLFALTLETQSDSQISSVPFSEEVPRTPRNRTSTLLMLARNAVRCNIQSQLQSEEERNASGPVSENPAPGSSLEENPMRPTTLDRKPTVSNLENTDASSTVPTNANEESDEEKEKEM